MKDYQLRIRVHLKEGILDPEAQSVFKALHQLGFDEVKKVSLEKVFQLETQAKDEAEAKVRAAEMAKKLLTNVVMENFEVELVG